MLLIWSGWEILVLPAVVCTAIRIGATGGLALRTVGHPELTFVGRRLDGKPPRERVDPTTSERVLPYGLHKLLRVRTEDGSVPMALAAFVPLLALRNRLAGRGPDRPGPGRSCP